MEPKKFKWSEIPENLPFEEEMYDVITSGDMILDVGCGSHKAHPKLLGVDAYAENDGVNLKAYMWDMPFGDQTIDGILCMAAMEHISKYKVLPTLAEFDRVLKVGAKAIILVPDLIWVLEAFIKNPNYDWEMDMIFGIQDHEGEYHRTGFTEDIFHKYFEQFPNFPIKVIHKVWAYNQQNLGLIAQRVS
jgi:predicted SAM-dependent methyltransferase